MPLMLLIVMETMAGFGYQGHIYYKHIHSFTEHETVDHSQSKNVMYFYSSLCCNFPSSVEHNIKATCFCTTFIVHTYT